jgi:hypothetical protein
MKKVLVFIIIAATTLSIPALAEEIRQLDWKDLIPGHLISQDPLAGLTQIQKDAVIWVINVLESSPEGKPETEEYYKAIRKVPSFKKVDIDINKVIKKKKRFKPQL